MDQILPSESFERLDALLAYARFWLAMAFTAVWTVVCFTGTLFGLLVPGDAGRRWQLYCARTWAAGILRAARCPVQVTRLSRAVPAGGFLYFSNHASMLDILALFVALEDTPFVFAAKRELFRVPFIGWHLRLAGYVEVDRDNRDRAISSFARAARQIRERGAIVTVYPEGTRSTDGTILPFKKGPFMLALEAQVPIVPVAVDGAQHAPAQAHAAAPWASHPRGGRGAHRDQGADRARPRRPAPPHAPRHARPAPARGRGAQPRGAHDRAARQARRGAGFLRRAVLLLALCAACAARQKQDETALLREAQADLAAGKPEEAQREFEEVLARDPRELAAVRGRIEAARKRGALEPLLRDLRDLRDHAGDADGFYALGLAEFASGNEGRAVAALRKAAELRPSEADIQYRLGVVLLDGEKFAEARAPLAQAAQLAPRVARYRPPLSMCLSRLGDRKAALEALRGFARLDPTPDEAALAVQVARSITDLFRDLPPPARSDLEQALGYLMKDAPGIAAPQLETLLARLPDLAPAHALLGLAAARLDESGRAVTELRRAAELAPELPQPHAWLAELYAAKEKPELAVQEYAAALERNPLDPETLRHLGTLRLERGLSGALDPLQEAAVLAPADDGLQLLVARAEIAAGQAGPARERLERLVERRPEDAEVLLRLAMLLFDERARAQSAVRRDLTQRVESLLRRVIALQPENAAANRLLTALRAG